MPQAEFHGIVIGCCPRQNQKSLPEAWRPGVTRQLLSSSSLHDGRIMLVAIARKLSTVPLTNRYTWQNSVRSKCNAYAPGGAVVSCISEGWGDDSLSILTSLILHCTVPVPVPVVDREMFAVTKRTSLVSWLEEWFSSLFHCTVNNPSVMMKCLLFLLLLFFHFQQVLLIIVVASERGHSDVE